MQLNTTPIYHLTDFLGHESGHGLVGSTGQGPTGCSQGVARATSFQDAVPGESHGIAHPTHTQGEGIIQGRDLHASLRLMVLFFAFV